VRNRVQELRAEFGWTQEELGTRVGVSRQAINAIEGGKHDPSIDLAFRISALFNQPVEAIFVNPHRGKQGDSGRRRSV